jgi:hypothetical protein
MRTALQALSLRAVALGLGVLFSAQGATPAALTWEPVVFSSSLVATDELFPAQILAVASAKRAATPARYLGDSNGVLGIVATATKPGAHLQVTVRLDGFADDSTFAATLPEANQQYELWPTMRFDSRALARLQQAVPTTAVFSVVMDGVSLGDQTRTVTMRSVNDVPLAYRQKDGGALDTSNLFAGFVNENSPVVEKILGRALDVRAVDRFKGYQGTPQDVAREVFAVWNVLQREGVKYSSIPMSSGQSQAVFSQHVRFPDETYQNRQANCVDGSVLIASVLYKLGIYPQLVLVPGHMFVGYFTDSRRQQIQFLETTRIGEPGLSQMRRDWRFLTPSSYLDSESYRQFLQAEDIATQRYLRARSFFTAKAAGYRLIDVDLARRAGISPIPRFAN